MLPDENIHPLGRREVDEPARTVIGGMPQQRLLCGGQLALGNSDLTHGQRRGSTIIPVEGGLGGGKSGPQLNDALTQG